MCLEERASLAASCIGASRVATEGKSCLPAKQGGVTATRTKENDGKSFQISNLSVPVITCSPGETGRPSFCKGIVLGQVL